MCGSLLSRRSVVRVDDLVDEVVGGVGGQAGRRTPGTGATGGTASFRAGLLRALASGADPAGKEEDEQEGDEGGARTVEAGDLDGPGVPVRVSDVLSAAGKHGEERGADDRDAEGVA